MATSADVIAAAEAALGRVGEELSARTRGTLRLASLVDLQAMIDDHPFYRIHIVQGDYTLDTLTQDEITVRGGVVLDFDPGSTVTFNNPVKGVFIITGSGSMVRNANAIGDYGGGLTIPRFGWNAGDADWIAWRAAYVAANPTHVLPSATSNSFKTAWNTLFGVQVVDDWHGKPGRSRNSAFFEYDTDYGGFDTCYARNVYCGALLRGSTVSPDDFSVGNLASIRTEFCDFGVQYSQQDRALIHADFTDGLRTQGIEPHAIYATNDGDSTTSKNCTVSSRALRCNQGHVVKIRSNTNIRVPFVTATDAQGLFVAAEGVTGVIGDLILDDQNITVGGTGQAPIGIDINGSPGLEFVGVIKGQARASTVDVPQDDLVWISLTDSNGVKIRSWEYACSRLSTSGADHVNQLANSSGCSIRDGDYNDAGGQGIIIWSVETDAGDTGGTSDNNDIVIGRAVGTNNLVRYYNVASNNMVTVDTGLIESGYDALDSVRNVGLGTGNTVRFADLNRHTASSGIITASQSLEATAAAKFTIETGLNLAAGETVTVGSKTYTMVASYSATANAVVLGADAMTTAGNLRAAINTDTYGGAGSGVIYGAATVIHPDVSATSGGPELNVVAKVRGASGNAIAVSDTAAHGSWGGATLTGGTEADIGLMFTTHNITTSTSNIVITLPLDTPYAAWVGFYKRDTGSGSLTIKNNSGATLVSLRHATDRAILRHHSSTGWAVESGSFKADVDIGGTADQAGDFVVNTGAGRVVVPGGVRTVATDADFTLVPLTDKRTQIHTGTLTANRTVTLSTTGVYAGYEWEISRSGAGAFNLSVGGLKNLTTGTWCRVRYDGSAWKIVAYGSL